MGYVIAQPVQPFLPVAGFDDVFPVRRIYCIGRNYADHAREMGHDPDREPPFFFQKNPQNIYCGDQFPYPQQSQDVHFEIELAVALKSGGRDVAVDAAGDLIFGYAVGLDMTRRDLQSQAKKAGRPWDTAKAFENSAPCSSLHTVEEVGHPRSGRIWLDVNGEPRQNGDLSQMIWSVEEQISYLSNYFELAAGDVVFSGTPAGVGPIQRGDIMRGGVEGLCEFSVEVI